MGALFRFCFFCCRWWCSAAVDKKNNNERVVGTVIRFPWSFLSTTWVYVCPGMTFICTIRSRHSSTTTDQWYALQASDYSSRRQFKYEGSTLIRPLQLLLSFRRACIPTYCQPRLIIRGPLGRATTERALMFWLVDIPSWLPACRGWGNGDWGKQGATYIIQKANTLRNMNWNNKW